MDQAIIEKYQETIGLECHIQLLTNSKAYSRDLNEYGSLPNTNITPITLGHPGTLPRSNRRVFDYAIRLGLAVGAEITEYNYYDRKNYFYPDLPKGYQVTQDATPICRGGQIEITLPDGSIKTVRLTRIHMEEDSGKSLHMDGEEESFVDLNRAGVPLLELVTEPDISSKEEAYAFLVEVRKLVRYLDICDGNMEEGSLRCDANVSVALKGATEFGTKVEVKNMNSFRNVQRAIGFEIERQVSLNEEDSEISGETRQWDAETGTTRSMRSKEQANDYRYFPEPDLQPVFVTQEWISDVAKKMPPLPRALKKKFIEDYKLPEYDAIVLTDTKEVALYFEDLCQKTKNFKAASNWVMGPIKAYINELTMTIDTFPLNTDQIAGIINMIDENKINNSIANQKLFPLLLENSDRVPEELAQEHNLIQNSDSGEILGIVEQVVENNPDVVERYKAGNKKLLGMFMGEVMKLSKGKADPKIATQLIKETLDK